MRQTVKKTDLLIILILAGSFAGCRDIAVPRPKGYFRIDLPVKEYRSFNDSLSGIPVKFEYPAYGTISALSGGNSEPGWFNIDFPHFGATIYLTYKNINNDLEGLMEQTYRMNVKNHIAKADAIDEQVINDPARKIYGILYDLKGNTATAVQFFVTDSTYNYLRGSLYFKTVPNPDSLAPVVEFFREDIIHLIETLKWKEK
jgi:gliding motility-associated lipoprotein GldD